MALQAETGEISGVDGVVVVRLCDVNVAAVGTICEHDITHTRVAGRITDKWRKNCDGSTRSHCH